MTNETLVNLVSRSSYVHTGLVHMFMAAYFLHLDFFFFFTFRFKMN